MPIKESYANSMHTLFAQITADFSRTQSYNAEGNTNQVLFRWQGFHEIEGVGTTRRQDTSLRCHVLLQELAGSAFRHRSEFFAIGASNRRYSEFAVVSVRT